MRRAVISWVIVASTACATVAHADGNDAPSTWMLQANPYGPDAPDPTPPPPTQAPTASASDLAPATPPDETGTATVSFAVRTAAGADIPHARVLMDGQVLTDALQGWAVSIPAGMHLFEFDGPGYTSQEHAVVIHAGTVGELVTIALAPSGSESSAAPPIAPWNARTVIFQPHAASYEMAPPRPNDAKEDPWMVTYVAGGTAIAALAIGTALGISASNQVAELRQTCAPNCTDSELDSVRSKMLVADVAFGAGIVSGGIAVVWALTHPRESDRPTHAHVGFDAHGVAGTF